MDNEVFEIFRDLAIKADEVLEYDTPIRVLRFMHATEKALKVIDLLPSGWGSDLASKGWEIEEDG